MGHQRVAQSVPVDVALVVTDVNAVDGVPLRIVRVAIDCAPSESRRSDESRVEHPTVGDHHEYAHSPPCPARELAEGLDQTVEETNGFHDSVVDVQVLWLLIRLLLIRLFLIRLLLIRLLQLWQLQLRRL